MQVDGQVVAGVTTAITKSVSYAGGQYVAGCTLQIK